MVFFLFDWFSAGLLLAAFVQIFFVRKWIQFAFIFWAILTVLAFYYIRLGATWLGLTHLVIYVGGILILQLFGMMLTQRSHGFQQVQFKNRGLALILTFVTLGLGWQALKSTSLASKQVSVYSESSLAAMGHLLLDAWLVLFELLSVLLLLGLMAATFLVRQKRD